MQQSAGSSAHTVLGASSTVQQSNPSPIPPNPYLAPPDDKDLSNAAAIAPNSYQPTPDDKDFSHFDFSQPFSANQTFSGRHPPGEGTSYSPSLQHSTQAPAYGGSAGGVSSAAAAAAAAPSTDLVRRTKNQQLAAPNSGGLAGQDLWHTSGYGAMNGQNMEDEDERELERKVQEAKREAQGKRKQIPPFVQKLSSFLDSNNTDLIRWSDNGRSFIVLDEDEFARTLIPELFKHNNYASFVRQLNMYGFHKTVNITDGSLRQSEKARKGLKPPSMYWHPYFRKNRPDLLWLIQKPSTKSGKRKRDGTMKYTYDSDDERQFSPGPGGELPGEIGAPGGAHQDLAQLPRSELAAVRRELKQLQNQQRYISQMITQLKEQNDQFYRQATAFQALHDRHENSINAILTFLATFYNRSLDGHGAQNLVNMFSNQAPTQQTQDNRVVEEFGDGPSDGDRQLQRFTKRPPLLLPGPIAPLQQQDGLQQPHTAVTEPNSARTSVSPPGGPSKRENSSSVPPENINQGTASPRIKNDAPTPNFLNKVPEKDEMMSLINNINSTNASAIAGTTAPTYDFSTALDHFQTANGHTPLTAQQRNDMLAMIANQHGNDPTQNNALISPQPPPMPDLNQFKATQQQLEMLTNMQKLQDEKVQELNRRLQPLSPTGTIPGLDQGMMDDIDITGAPGDYDPGAFINFDDSGWNSGAPVDLNFDFGTDAGNGAVDGDFNFDFGGGTQQDGEADQGGCVGGGADGDMFQTSTFSPLHQQQQQQQPSPRLTHEPDGGGRVESISSEATSPLGTGDELPEVPDRKRPRTST
ncbi:hypothetical protein M433DRAFT_483818 [Acidomyces richmondensis BFW]|nr:MAG: hypothetical protein FE78DRAFT_279397 [Acidomyces sp. 'richmondensis']KYG47650.1 hypothetical protein M433DRAFT_483818 [Acidomyces richmondensis BFW]